MTLENMCNASADQLAGLSQSELEAILSPYLHVTRPERALKPIGQERKEQASKEVQRQFLAPGKVEALESLKSQGVDIGALLGNINRKKWKK